MQYELYADSLFLVNFVMNLYLLLLVRKSTLCTATPGRLFLGAAFGAAAYFLPFFLPGGRVLKLSLSMVFGIIGMSCITFRINSLKAFFKVLEKMLLYTFFLGGLVLFVIRSIPSFRNSLLNIFGIMGMGGAGFYLLSRFLRGRKKDIRLCRATLIRGKDKMTVTALLDSGNSLVEPISGKPVSIVEKSIFKSLWREEAECYRAIPYHSIGKKRGILQGYLLPELLIEADGEVKSCKNVYIAVCEETGKVKMILHPALLQEDLKWRKNEDDIKGGNTGKNAV